MPIKEEVRISDNGISTLKKIQEEHKSFREELTSTRKELKQTWDKRYKPVIETTGAFKSIKAIQSKAAGMKDSLKAKIHIDSNMKKLNQARNKMTAFGKMIVSPVVRIKNTSKNKMDSLYKKMLKIGKTTISPAVKLKDNATTKIRKMKTEISYLSKTIARPAVVLKDKASALMQTVGSRLKDFSKKSYRATLTAVDKTARGIASATSKLASVAKKVAIPVTIATTVATAGIGATAKSGMELENQQISIKHFIGATNKNYTEGQINEAAQSFTEALRDNANATPFETGEVIAAGSRAISITQGNTKSAMNMVKLAEDMAAASGGTQSVGDAIEALADAKLGEMERLKSFGFKVSAEDFKKKGFEGVSKDLEGFFGGAASKLATSGSGLVSTITGKLKSSVADFGLKIVDQLKPVLTNIIALIDKAMPFIDKMGTAFGNSLGKGIKVISSMMPSFINGFKQMMPTFQVIISGIQQMLPPILSFGSTIVGTIRNIVVQSTPVISSIIFAISRILPAVQPIFSMIATTVGNIVTTVLPPLGNAFSMIADVIVALAPVVQTVFGGISEFIGGAVSGIAEVIQGGLDLISSLWSGNWQGVVDSFSTIFGGIAEICKAPVNAVIAILNSCIDAINSVSVDIPDYVPFIGGNHLGFNLDKIPMLAKGGVVKQATTAIVGEAGKEAVMPLERNTGWIGQLANQIGSYMSGMNLNISALSSSDEIPMRNSNPSATISGRNISVMLTIAKLADQVIVNDKGDIDNLADAVAQKLLEVLRNL